MQKYLGYTILLTVIATFTASTTLAAPKFTLRQKPKPDLYVVFIAHKPVKNGVVAAGKTIDISFTIANKGTAPTTSADTYTVSCKVLSGGPSCPIANTTGPLPRINPKSSRNMSLYGIIKAKPGKYQVTVKVNPGGRGPIKSKKSKDIRVVGIRAVKRIPRHLRHRNR